MKIKIGDSGDNSPRVDVVPLIDVIFCILTFFLLSGIQMVRQQVISVDLPQVKTDETQVRQSMMVTLGYDGNIFVQQQRSSPMVKITPAEDQAGALAQEVKAYKSTNPNGSITLSASKQVSYNQIAAVLSILRMSGGGIVSLNTEPIENISPTPAATSMPSVPAASAAPVATPRATVSPLPSVTPSR
jgi:biopolymer transport protein ExbD